MPYYGQKYCLVKWRQTPTGLVQDLPEGIRWRLLAEPPGPIELTDPNRDYGLYLLTWPEEMPWPPEIEFIPDELTELLDSAIANYPPAIAIARDKVRAGENAGKVMLRSEFIETLSTLLRDLLENQRNTPFFLAKVIKEEIGYKHTGKYYWIVGYKEYKSGAQAFFVSSDFWVYGSPATDFDIDLDWLKERFKHGDSRP